MAIAISVAGNAGQGTNGTATLFVTNVDNNDIMIGCVVVTSAAAIGGFTWPGGWSVMDTDESITSAISMRIEVGWKKFTTGDTTQNVTVTAPTQGEWRAHLMAYSGCDTTNPVTAHGLSVARTSSSAAAVPTQTAISGTSGLWRVGQFAGHRTSANGTWSTYTNTPADDTERLDQTGSVVQRRQALAMADSNGQVFDASSGTSMTSTPSTAIMGAIAHIALIQPSSSPQSAQPPRVLNATAIELSSCQ